MGKSKWLVAGTLALGATAAFADGSTFQITPFASESHLSVDHSIMRDGGNKRVENLEVGARVGLRVPGGFLIEAGGAASPGELITNWFKDVTMNHAEVAIGYQLDTPSGFRFVPKVGRMRWELDGEGKAFVNSAGEFHRNYVGYDYFYEAAFMYNVKPKVALGLVARSVDSDLIDARQVSFAVTMSF